MFRTIMTGTLFATLTASLVAVIGGSLASGDYQNPLAPYADITPGQPDAVLDPFTCEFEYTISYLGMQSAYCRLRPQDSRIESIGIQTRGSQIEYVTFALEGIQVGHLIDRYDRPDVVRQRSRATILCWREGVVAIARTRLPLSFRAPVVYLSLSNPDSAAYTMSGRGDFCRAFTVTGSQ